MENYKAVLFDFNGTLFFDDSKHILAWSKMAKEIRGYEVSEQELREHMIGVPNQKIVEYLCQGNCSEEQVEKISQTKEAYYREYCKADQESFHLVQGAYEYFAQLKEQGIPFTIASASIKPNIDFFVESFHLDQWVDPANIVYDDGSYSNKVEMFKTAAHLLGVEVSDCQIIEDSPSGIKNAYEAGCRKIVVMDQAHQETSLLAKPGVIQVIHSFEELLKNGDVTIS